MKTINPSKWRAGFPLYGWVNSGQYYANVTSFERSEFRHSADVEWNNE